MPQDSHPLTPLVKVPTPPPKDRPLLRLAFCNGSSLVPEVWPTLVFPDWVILTSQKTYAVWPEIVGRRVPNGWLGSARLSQYGPRSCGSTPSLRLQGSLHHDGTRVLCHRGVGMDV